LSAERSAPRILCAGIVVLDEVFRVVQVPPVDTKTDARDYMTVGGGCAANAAVAIARLGGRVSFAGPLGDDDIGARTLANLAQEQVDTAGCVLVKGGRSSVSAILVDDSGARTIATYSDPRLLAAVPANVPALVAEADGLLLDNRRPNFVIPICEEATQHDLRIVLDADKPTTPDDPLLKMATHVIFSGESLRGTVKTIDSREAVQQVQKICGGFVAMTDGANDVLWCDGGAVQALKPFKVTAIDTLAAGDVFHGAFTLALLEGQSIEDALRFSAAASAVKVTRFGGSATAPTRAEVEAMLAGKS
jgi:sugar/nucleoside kinase (ribokinase family)